MTTILINTTIAAPIKTVFDLSRNIDVHQNFASKTNDVAVDGVVSGLINEGETVTWRGKHFGLLLMHKSLITNMVFCVCFTDEMVEGHFSFFKHEHLFQEEGGKTVMTDKLQYKTPFWIAGKIFDWLLLKSHMTTFLLNRNAAIKRLAES